MNAMASRVAAQSTIVTTAAPHGTAMARDNSAAHGGKGGGSGGDGGRSDQDTTKRACNEELSTLDRGVPVCLTVRTLYVYVRVFIRV